jgi:hypothetical protein
VGVELGATDVPPARPEQVRSDLDVHESVPGVARPVGVGGEAQAYGAESAVWEPVDRCRHEGVERGEGGMSVAKG